ncbi:GNAT family N-acetyltransferase [Curtobacterium sp. Csp2]|nr:GNAT family N-acetyltransferase [Curtobacterium sp. Csp2]
MVLGVPERGVEPEHPLVAGPHLDVDLRASAREQQPFELGHEGAAEPGALVGAGMAGYDGHRGWVNYLAVHPDHQGTGLGRAFMAEFERLLLARGCPKVNVQVRAGNERVLGFYASLGYAEDHAVSLGKRLVADD